MNKFHARRTKCFASHVHDSKKEAERCNDLMMLQRAGQIFELEIHKRIPLHAYGGEVVGHIVPDFRFIDHTGTLRYQDVKSPPTRKLAMWRWKKKHFEKEYKTTIAEV